MIIDLFFGIILMVLGFMALFKIWGSNYSLFFFLLLNVASMVLIAYAIKFILSSFITHDFAGQRWLFGRRL